MQEIQRGKEKVLIISSVQHAENRGVSCPVCMSGDLDYMSQGYEAPHFWQRVHCLDCGSSWLNVYRLAGYEELILGIKATGEE